MKTNKLPRLFSILLVAISWFGIFPATAHAWGTKGHQIIASIARQRLSARARKAVNNLLKNQSLELASTWAAQQKSSQAFHFVLIPWDSKGYEREQHCADGNCLIEKIKYYRDVLQDPKESDLNRVNALKYLIHLVGDLHQPFHCIDKDGKLVKVTFDKRPTTLFNLWESGMIERPQLTTEKYAQTVENTEQTTRGLARGTLVDWALESHALARRAYVEGGDLGDKYYEDNKWIVDGQLRKAGVRLADILNDIFR